MKHQPTFLLLFGLFSVSAVFGQTKLQIANSNINSFLGQINSGDSTTIAYNSNLQPNLNKTWKLDLTTGTWGLKSRIIDHAYDAEGRLLYSLTQEGDDVNGWVDVRRTSFTFDAEGRELSVVNEKWDGVQWLIQWASYKVYDMDGKLLSSAGIGTQYLYSYNAEGLLETQTYQELQNGVWTDRSQTQYTYFPNSTLVESKSTHVWDFVNNVWLETGRELFSYYPNGDLFQTTFGHWNGTSWENSSRTSLSYDSEGYQTEALSEEWEGNAWVNQARTTFSYDVNHNLLEFLSEQWDGGNWKSSSRQINKYDAESNILNLRLDLWDGAAWGLLNYRRFHYADFVGANSPEGIAFDVFPNPANTSVTIQGEALRQVLVFDAQGRLVHLQNLQGQFQESIQMGGLPDGNYLLQVQDKTGKTGAKPLQIRR